MATPDLIIRPFEATDQDAARSLILEGLRGHFGFIDETMNPDLDDIASTFSDGVFLVAEIGGRIAGTGGLLFRDDSRCQIVRMSTGAPYRRRGVASALLSELIALARDRGAPSVFLATNLDWQDAIGLYRSSAFLELGRNESGILFGLDL
jgi:ribosomal protein S18 acetylase RimI-like enzyme